MSAICANPADNGTDVLDKVPLDKVRALQHTLYRTAKADPAPRAAKPWRGKPNAGGERRR